MDAKMKKWRKDHPLYEKDYREKNRKKISVDHKKWSLKNKDRIKKNTFIYNNSHKGKFSQYKNGAKRKNREFLLTIEEFISIISLCCHYCGTTREIGVDRKDNLIGYIKSNCLPSCWGCNNFKGSKDYYSFIKKCKEIGKNLN